MEKLSNNKHISLLFSVLLFGGLWGLIEATLGSILHIGFIADTLGLFASSTVVMLPIAYFFLGSCYRKTGTYRSMLYMGLFAAGIKAIGCAVFAQSFNACIYIGLEALVMSGAMLVMKPTKVISYKSFAAFAIFSTVYLAGFVAVNALVKGVEGYNWANQLQKYVVTSNGLAILYALVAGFVIHGFVKLSEKYSWNMDGVKKVIYHPATAGVVACLAVVATILL